MRPATRQRDVLAVGRLILRRMREHARAGSPLDWVDDAAMRLAMRDERLKAALFRFVDALPALRGAQAAGRHLREHLRRAIDAAPAALRPAVALLPRRGPLTAAVGMAADLAARRMAGRFIAADSTAQAVRAALRLRRRDQACTIDVLGEAVVSEAEADRHLRVYLDLIRLLTDGLAARPPHPLLDRDDRGRLPRASVSVKLSSLYSRFDPADETGTRRGVLRRLMPLLESAQAAGAAVTIDMEQHAFKDAALGILKAALSDPALRAWGDGGIAMQAYLRDTFDDLGALADYARTRGAPLHVRLVKGAYWDYETVIAAQNGWPTPVFTRKAETDASFERCAALLIERREWLRPAIASHNARSLSAALVAARRAGAADAAIEFQVLYGMGDAVGAALTSLGRRVRVYCPVGPMLPGMAYLVRRLLENTSNESFIRAEELEGKTEDDLLMDPADATDRAPRRAPSDATPAFANEPPTDFARDDARRRLRAALAGPFAVVDEPLVIAGRRVATAERIESRNPSRTDEVVGRAASAGPSEAAQAVEAAAAAFPLWRATPVADRAALLRRAAETLRRRRFELAALIVREVGKPWRDADADVAEAIDFCVYYASEAQRLAGGRRRDVPGEANEMTWDARGVCAVIAPWNFPLAILCGMSAAALATGNTVVMKPAEQAPIVAAELMRAFEQAGAPPGVVIYLPGTGERAGAALVAHPQVTTIAFTGSRAVGLSIQRSAADVPPGQRHVKRVVCEMGGKNAIVVDEDADLDEAIAGVIASAFGYAGQKCSACSRLIVVEAAYDALLPRLIEATRSLQVGPADDPGTGVPPVIDEAAQLRILAAVARGRTEARLAFAGEVGPQARDGWHVAPHIFTEVAPTSFLAREEIFGPVLAVLRCSDLEEGLSIANDSDYALTGGLYSRNPESIERARRDFRVGNLYINRRITGALVDRQPFGGFRLSGIGAKAGGQEYLQQFMVPRCITENTLRRGFAPQAESLALG